MKIKIGDVVKLKKQHPCGSFEWNVIREGMDIKLCCKKCKKIIMVSREKFKDILDKFENTGNEKIRDKDDGVKKKNWIKNIENPTLEEMRISIMENPMTIRFLQNPPEEIVTLAIKENPMCIEFVKNLSLEQQKLAIKGNIATIRFIEQPNEEIVKFAKVLYPDAMKQYFRGNDGNFIRIKNIEVEGGDFTKMSPKSIMRVLEENGDALQFFEKPTIEMVKKAIDNHPSAIKFIHNPTDEVKRYAVESNPEVMKQYTVHKDGIVKIITKENEKSIYEDVIGKMSYEERVLIENPNILSDLDNVPYEVQLFAVKKDYLNLQYIKKVDPRIYEYLYDDKSFDLYSLYDNFSLQLKITYAFEAIEKKRKKLEDKINKEAIEENVQIKRRKKIEKNIQNIFEEIKKVSYSISIIDGEMEIDVVLNELAKKIEIEAVNIASGFLYKSGLDSLQELFEKVYEKEGEVQMIIGSLKEYYSASSDKKLLNIDLETARELNKMIIDHNCKIYTLENRFFHGKYYFLKGGRYRHA